MVRERSARRISKPADSTPADSKPAGSKPADLKPSVSETSRLCSDLEGGRPASERTVVICKAQCQGPLDVALGSQAHTSLAPRRRRFAPTAGFCSRPAPAAGAPQRRRGARTADQELFWSVFEIRATITS